MKRGSDTWIIYAILFVVFALFRVFFLSFSIKITPKVRRLEGILWSVKVREEGDVFCRNMIKSRNLLTNKINDHDDDNDDSNKFHN